MVRRWLRWVLVSLIVFTSLHVLLQQGIPVIAEHHLRPGRATLPPLSDDAAASMWSQGLSWRNGTYPEFGGRCDVTTLPQGCAALVRDDDRRGCDFVACMPNLFLIGTSKSGTTTLFEALASHPRIFEMYAEENTDGETHIFTYPRTDYVLRAARWAPPLPYSTLLDLAPDDEKSWGLADARNGPAYVLEYTPHYVVMPEAPDRLCSTLKIAGAPPCEQAKYVVMLRDPAARVFSQYVMKTHMRISKYNDPRSFDDVVVVGRNRTLRFAQCWDNSLEDEVTLDDFQSRRFKTRIRRLATGGACNVRRYEKNLFQAYVLKSAYYYQLLPWFAGVDDPRASFIISTLEAFGRSELARVLDFLGLAIFAQDHPRRDGFHHEADLLKLVSAKRNVARDGGISKMSSDQRRRLDNIFRPMNHKLDVLTAPLLGGRPTGYPT